MGKPGNSGKSGSEARYYCVSCGKKFQPILRDNTTYVPCCDACWETMTPTFRVWINGIYRQSFTMEKMLEIMTTTVEEQVAIRMQERDRIDPFREN